MSRITLREFQTERDIRLSVEQRDALRRIHRGMRLEPSELSNDRYDLTPDQRVGVVVIPGLTIEIRPKIPMASVLFLVAWACDAVGWFDEQAEYAHGIEFTDLVAVMLARVIEHTTRRGLLHGYRTTEESLSAPRGRVLFDEQLRRHLRMVPPVHVRHDEFTADILENRLLRAALSALARTDIRSTVARRELIRAQRLFGEVSRVEYKPWQVPEVVFTRLNRHYHAAVELASLVLRSATLDLGTSGVPGAAFLVDMNVVFEQFVRKALRRTLDADIRSFPDRPPALHLDGAGRVPLRPDLCFMAGSEIQWVADAKYKRLPAGAYTNADLYQLLAYTITLGLDEGTLIYAADAGVSSRDYVIPAVNKTLRVRALDLSAPPRAILGQLEEIAGAVPTGAARAM